MRCKIFTAVTILIMFFWRLDWLVEAKVSEKRAVCIFRAEPIYTAT
jgi:hypothetical protein